MIDNDSFWLINSNRTEVKRFQKNHKSKSKFFEYMFVDTGEVIGILGDKPPIMKTRISLKTFEARDIYKRLISQGWQQTKPSW